MKISELKELIRQELEEHLFAHPSKHKGRFAHPGSQPHVKDAKKNAKTINVRHKKTKEKLDIPDDPATIKKYKKLGYTLWIGSRGKYESVDERTIQEHDKAKVLQAMLKAGSNKAEAQALLKKHYAYVDKKYADSPASKKAEIIVTLAGTASESTINESASYREAELKKVAQMTDRNQHLEARHFVAKKGGYTKHVKAYTALIALQDALGHTPRGAEQVRSDLDKDLKKYLSKDVDNWKDVWEEL
jgi:hypothetical protein